MPFSAVEFHVSTAHLKNVAFVPACRLFIIGGSPLTNDVWAGQPEQSSTGTWFFVWENMASGSDVPFSPRAGLGECIHLAVIVPPLVRSLHAQSFRYHL